MRRYSLEEAAALLPTVVPVLEALRAAYVEMRALEASISAQSRGASGDGQLVADPWDKDSTPRENRLDALTRTIQQSAIELDNLGIQLKDPEKGLIDFFHEREGRIVYLCFHLGEAEIQFWHELNTGFAGRQAL